MERDPNIFKFGYMPLSKLLNIYHIVGRVGYANDESIREQKSTSDVKQHICIYAITALLRSRNVKIKNFDLSKT